MGHIQGVTFGSFFRFGSLRQFSYSSNAPLKMNRYRSTVHSSLYRKNSDLPAGFMIWRVRTSRVFSLILLSMPRRIAYRLAPNCLELSEARLLFTASAYLNLGSSCNTILSSSSAFEVSASLRQVRPRW